MKKNTCIFLIILAFLIFPYQKSYANNLISKINILNYFVNKYSFKNRHLDDMQILSNDRTLIIKVKSDAPANLSYQRYEAYHVLKPYFKKDMIKAVLIWQKDKYDYGKIAAVSGSYINNFLEEKTSKEEFIKHFSLSLLEPLISRNKISQIKKEKVSEKIVYQGYILRKRADLYREANKLDEANKIYKQALEINKYDIIALYWLGQINVKKKEYQKAKEHFTQALCIDPEFKAADLALYELNSILK